MTEQTMMERVARAMWPHMERRPVVGSDHFEGGHHLDRELTLRLARAAIEAMREPTIGMVNAYCRLESDEGASGLVSTDAWQAMIDAALEEG